MKYTFIAATTVLLFLSNRSDSKILLAIPVFDHHSTALSKPTEKIPGISDLKIKEIEKLLGRKLKFKEKLGIKFYQWKIKKGFIHGDQKEYKDKGRTALLFGIIGMVSLLLFPVAFLGVLPALAFGLAALLLGKKAKKENPGDKRARTAIILGWITLGILTAAAIFIILFLSTNGWGIE